MNVTIYPPRFHFADFFQSGSLPIATGALQAFAPPISLAADNGINSFECFAVTPKATTFTILSHTSGNFSLVTVDDSADVDLNAALPGQHDSLGDLRRLLIYARRKRGTTGTIAAQTVTVRKNDNAGTVLATFGIPPTAASTEIPACGVDQTYTSGQIANPTGYHFTVTAADPDLELVCMAFGEN